MIRSFAVFLGLAMVWQIPVVYAQPFMGHPEEDIHITADASAVCENQTEAQIYMSFTEYDIKAQDAGAYLKGVDDTIHRLAKEKGIETLVLNSSNYTLSPLNIVAAPRPEQNLPVQPYQLNVNIGYALSSSDEAAGLFDALKKQGYNPNLSVSNYRLCQ